MPVLIASSTYALNPAYNLAYNPTYSLTYPSH